ncbi:MAG: KH domain-containing protein [Candidatus Micrarchaeaceae archaeon]|jgi:ribosomal RNA assembly protein
MQQLYIPAKRLRLIRDKKYIIETVERQCGCKVTIGSDDVVEINGDAFSEFNAKNMLQAFGRGFDIETACKLNDMDYYFASIDLEQLVNSEKRKKQVKARIIGREGRTKKYIEEVSGAKISIYGDTASFLGTIDEINEAETAVNTLIDGGTHRLAYARMEAAHRKNKRQARAAKF